MPSSSENIPLSVVPFLSEAVAALCITGPSAIGSLNGIPTSIISMPLRSSDVITSAQFLVFGWPAQKYIESMFCFLLANSLLILFISYLCYEFF